MPYNFLALSPSCSVGGLLNLTEVVKMSKKMRYVLLNVIRGHGVDMCKIVRSDNSLNDTFSACVCMPS